MSQSILSVKNLNVSYGAIHAVKGIDFEVNKGEIISLIGANGAGKTTTMRAISGLVESTGAITFKDKNLSEVVPHKRISLGISQSPEGRGVFAPMSVYENLLMGAYHRSDTAQIKKDIEEICYKLFPRLQERSQQLAGTLSGGEQQMLAISRALMARPELLLLDEPSLGLAPLIVAQIFEIIQKLNQDGMTVLLVEQNATMSLKISHRAYVLETGKIVLSGGGKELLNNDEVRRCYLGI